MKVQSRQEQAQGARPGYLRKAGAARFLDISVRGLSDLMSRGVVPYVKLGHKTVLFSVGDLDRAMQRYRVQAVGEQPRKAG